MNITRHEIPYGSGSLTVRDYGGDGASVLLVHSPGFCALSWDQVAESLEGHVRALAIDLPGHGASTAAMRRPEDAWRSVVAVSRAMELSSPLLVGLSQGVHTCLAATIEARDTFAGVVALGGSCVRSQDGALDEIAFYTSPQFKEMLRHRFAFGFSVETEREAEDLIEHMAARLATDWRVVGFKGLRDEMRYSIRPDPMGGGWVNLPTPETIQTTLGLDPESRYFPSEELYRHIDVPVVIVQLADGLDQELSQRERDLAIANDLVSVRGLDAGEYPHYTRHHEVAAIIRETCTMLEHTPHSPTVAEAG